MSFGEVDDRFVAAKSLQELPHQVIPTAPTVIRALLRSAVLAGDAELLKRRETPNPQGDVRRGHGALADVFQPELTERRAIGRRRRESIHQLEEGMGVGVV